MAQEHRRHRVAASNRPRPTAIDRRTRSARRAGGRPRSRAAPRCADPSTPSSHGVSPPVGATLALGRGGARPARRPRRRTDPDGPRRCRRRPCPPYSPSRRVLGVGGHGRGEHAPIQVEELQVLEIAGTILAHRPAAASRPCRTRAVQQRRDKRCARAVHAGHDKHGGGRRITHVLLSSNLDYPSKRRTTRVLAGSASLIPLDQR